MAVSTIKATGVKSTDITVTTTSTGAVQIPTAYQQRLVDWYDTSAARLIFRRDVSYLMVRDLYNPATPVANTQVTIRLLYI